MEELYAKRGFRCDCGNDKFPGFECQLVPKTGLNSGNVYGQNFQGRYCYCHGKYVLETDTMAQCLVCQDWFHDRCLGTAIPDDESELICKECAAPDSVLQAYDGRASTYNGNTEGCVRPNRKIAAGYTELFVPHELETLLCHCQACDAAYKTQGLGFLLETQAEANTQVLDLEVDESAELTASFDLDRLAQTAMEKVDPSVAREVVAHFRDFMDVIKDDLSARVGTGQTLVTEKDVHEVLQRANDVLGKRRRDE